MGESANKPESEKMRVHLKIPKKKGFVDYFKDYCDYTGIHGFIYIAEDRTPLER